MDENGIQSFALGILFVSPFFGFRIQWMSDANSGFMFLRLSKKHYELSSQEIEVSAIKLPLYLIPTLLLLIFWDRFGSGVAAVLSVLQEGRYLPRNFISHHHCNRAR